MLFHWVNLYFSCLSQENGWFSQSLTSSWIFKIFFLYGAQIIKLRIMLSTTIWDSGRQLMKNWAVLGVSSVSLVSKTIGLLSIGLEDNINFPISYAKGRDIFTRLAVPKIWSPWAIAEGCCLVITFAVNNENVISTNFFKFFFLSIFEKRILGIRH